MQVELRIRSRGLLEVARHGSEIGRRTQQRRSIAQPQHGFVGIGGRAQHQVVAHITRALLKAQLNREHAFEDGVVVNAAIHALVDVNARIGAAHDDVVANDAVAMLVALIVVPEKSRSRAAPAEGGTDEAILEAVTLDDRVGTVAFGKNRVRRIPTLLHIHKTAVPDNPVVHAHTIHAFHHRARTAAGLRESP